MNPPAADTEAEKVAGPSFHCDLYDADIVHKIAQELFPGLSSACVDNTIGGLFRTPASVAVEIRREMIGYLTQRSEAFVAESIVLDADLPADDPYHIVSDFIDDFVSSKRNVFSRLSGWLPTEKRDDRIDDFAHEMEVNGFWLLGQREFVAQTILKNVDFKSEYHCSSSFMSEEDVEEHRPGCGFRTVVCTNEGCDSRFSAARSGDHDSVCAFKVLECEQGCGESVMRRGMDRHCITVCSMKLMRCTFYSVGCQTLVPQSMVDQHRYDNLESHLLCILRLVHKTTEDLKGRVEELIQLSSPGKLAAARDPRSLTFAIKDLEAKLGPLKANNESTGAGGSPVSFEESPASNTEETVDPPYKEKENVSVQQKLDDNMSTVGKAAKPIKYKHNHAAEKQEESYN